MGYIIALLLLGILIMSLFKSENIDMGAIPGVIVSKRFNQEEVCWIIVVRIDIFTETTYYTYYPDHAEINQFKEGQNVRCIFDKKDKLKYIFK